MENVSTTATMWPVDIGAASLTPRCLKGKVNETLSPQGPEKGPDGRFHMAWVWRDTNPIARPTTIFPTPEAAT